ncbi:MAG TPA: DUF2007 domain-containing protein [Planctomycetota bacterium]
MAEPVELMSAQSPAEAQIVASLLESAGIPVQLNGEALWDEFAVSQRALGLLGTKVMVPEDRLEEARQVIAAARGDGADGVGDA